MSRYIYSLISYLFTQTKHSITSTLATFSIFNGKANRANLYFIPLRASTSRKRQLSAVRGSRGGRGVRDDGDQHAYQVLEEQAPTTRLILCYRLPSESRRESHTRRGS